MSQSISILNSLKGQQGLSLGRHSMGNYVFLLQWQQSFLKVELGLRPRLDVWGDCTPMQSSHC